MTEPIKAAFRTEIVVLDIERLTPLKKISEALRRSAKFKQIAASLRHVGLIEPIVVYPEGRGKYLVLDGHKRLDILKSSGERQIECLIATDDESYNYNRRTNYLSPIGEHFMILKAIRDGVSEERIAEALDVNVATIRKKRDLLDGICPETVELLRDRKVHPLVFASLRRMKPARQIECAGLMIAANKYTQRFAQALLSGTRAELLVSPPGNTGRRGKRSDHRAQLEHETDALLQDYKSVRQSYGTNVLAMSVSAGYIRRLLDNQRIARYLARRHADTFQELRRLVAELEDEKRRSRPVSERQSQQKAAS